LARIFWFANEAGLVFLLLLQLFNKNYNVWNKIFFLLFRCLWFGLVCTGLLAFSQPKKTAKIHATHNTLKIANRMKKARKCKQREKTTATKITKKKPKTIAKTINK